MPNDTPQLTPEESAAWVRLVALTELLPTALDTQLQRDHGITHFEYVALLSLAGAPNRTMRMTELASRTNATLPRLSHVARRLEERALIERLPCPEDRRATNATITEAGLRLLTDAGPGHIGTARLLVIDSLTPRQLEQLYEIAGAVLANLDPDRRLTATSCQFTELQATALAS